MNKAAIGAGAVVLAAAIVGSAALLGGSQKKQVDNQADGQTTTSQTKTIRPRPGAALNQIEVAKHNRPDDCWTIISGTVYDITKFISQHPGGAEILRACGNEATSLFQQRTTSSGEKVGSGTPHSSSAAEQLKQFELGPLVP